MVTLRKLTIGETVSMKPDNPPTLPIIWVVGFQKILILVRSDLIVVNFDLDYVIPWNYELLWNFIEITLQHGCFHVNLLHIFTTSFPKNICGRLLLRVLNTPHMSNEKQAIMCTWIMTVIFPLTGAVARRCSVKPDVLKNFAKFIGKHLCWSLFIKERLQHRCFTINVKYLRTLFLQNTSGHIYYEVHIMVPCSGRLLLHLTRWNLQYLHILTWV